MKLCRHAGWFMSMVAVLLTQPALGQNRIPYDIVTTESALTADQRERIEAYVDLRLAWLLKGQSDQVTQAREELIEPFGLVGASRIFTLAYSAAVSKRLINVIHSNDLLVRINTMIVAASLIDPGVVRLIEIGLTDDNPAMRYCAAKAVGDADTVDVPGTRRELSRDNQQQLLAAMKKAAEAESSQQVLHRLLLGIVSLEVPEAAVYLMEQFNQRVAQYTTDPSLPVAPMTQVLRMMYINLIQASARGKELSKDVIDSVTRVAFRYQVASAAILNIGAPTAEIKRAHIEMIGLTDSILNWVAQTVLDEGSPRPGSVKNELAIENWPGVMLETEDWRQLLLDPPFGFTAEELLVEGVHPR